MPTLEQSEEKWLHELEDQFPPLSGVAFDAARRRTLAAGLKVLESEDGILYEVFPNGSRRQIKKIDPPTKVENGLKITIR